MHLLAPWWWLLFPFLAGVLILLYLLKLRRQDHVVPSVFLWEQVLQDLHANAPLQKLRTHLLLILQLLLLLLVVFALSRPAMNWTFRSGQRVVAIIDCSASMASTDVTPSRFAHARQQLQKQIERLGPRDSMMLVAVGGSTRVITPFTRDRRALRTALDRLAVSDTRADFRSAFEIVAGLDRERKVRERLSIVIASDGAVPTVPLPKGLQVPIAYVSVGKRCENVGIVVSDIRWQPKHNTYEGLMVVRNFGMKPHTATLELYLDGKIRDARDITLAAGKEHSEVLSALPVSGGTLRATINLHDDLASDNTVQIILPRHEPIPVTLVSKENLFLETALKLDSTLKATQLPSIPATPATGTVLIVDNMTVNALPNGTSALLIGPLACQNAGVISGAVGKPLEAAGIVDWDRRHPATANLALTGMEIADAVLLAPKGSARVLMESDAGPVALSVQENNRRVVSLGWDIRNSDFPLRPSFPIFLRNTIAWLASEEEAPRILNIRAGGVARVPMPAGIGEVTVTAPDGRSERCKVNEGTLVIDSIPTVGLYRLDAGKVHQQLAANLLDAAESNTKPAVKFPMQAATGETVKTSSNIVKTEGEWWRWLLLAAVLVLLVEWWVYHRRIG